MDFVLDLFVLAQAAPNFNGIVIYDQQGKEYVQVHSENHDVSSNENSKLTRVGSNCSHVVGGIPGMGSGSGAGSSDPPTFVSGFNWPGTSGIGGWGKKLDVVVGMQMETVVGLMGDTVLGTYADIVINPLGLTGGLGEHRLADGQDRPGPSAG